MSPVRRVDRSTIREVSDLIQDVHQRDEMAAPSYLHGNPLVRWLFWQRLERALELLGPGPHGAGLDFGCGLGLFLPTLSASSAHVYATDPEPLPAGRLVAKLGLDNVSLMTPDGLEATIGSGALDYVVATDVLEHVPDLDDCIATFARLVKPGGRVVMSGPTETPLYRLGRCLAGFSGKESYHHTNVFHIRSRFVGSGCFALQASRTLPVPHVVEAFQVDRYRRA